MEGPGVLGCDKASGITRRSDVEHGWEYAEVEERAVGVRRLWGYDTQQACAPFLGFSNLNLAYRYGELPLISESEFNASPRGFASASLLRPGSFDPSREFMDISVRTDSGYKFFANLPNGERLFANLGFEKVDAMQNENWDFHGENIRIVRWNPATGEFCGSQLKKVAGFVELSVPGTIQVKRTEKETLLTTSTGLEFGPSLLRSPFQRIEVQELDGSWADVTGQCGRNGIPAELVQSWVRRNERTLVDFRVHT
jgi:hypothetical protein